SDFDASLLCWSLGQFLARMRYWGDALEMWQQVPPDPSVARNVLTGIVGIHLARALEASEAAIQLLRQREEEHNGDLELCLPGLENDLAIDAAKELQKLKRGIEKLLSEKSRKQLGIPGQRIEKSIEDQSQEAVGSDTV